MSRKPDRFQMTKDPGRAQKADAQRVVAQA
jgi:hypothetical protein